MVNNMPNLDMLLLKGPAGNVENGLNELRYTILTQGIPANSEGMVGLICLYLCARRGCKALAGWLACWLSK